MSHRRIYYGEEGYCFQGRVICRTAEFSGALVQSNTEWRIIESALQLQLNEKGGMMEFFLISGCFTGCANKF